ncbi:MAG: hypothetical protein KC414_14765, partial [Romboutsia sp.]|nr:hypothetical protein [Romboutsia sp.]
EAVFSEVYYTEFFYCFKYSGEKYIRYGGEVIYFLCEDPDGFLNEVFVRDIIEIDDAVEDKLDYALTLFKLKK